MCLARVFNYDGKAFLPFPQVSNSRLNAVLPEQSSETTIITSAIGLSFGHPYFSCRLQSRHAPHAGSSNHVLDENITNHVGHANSNNV